jgi:hypothetical protein
MGTSRYASCAARLPASQRAPRPLGAPTWAGWTSRTSSAPSARSGNRRRASRLAAASLPSTAIARLQAAACRSLRERRQGTLLGELYLGYERSASRRLLPGIFGELVPSTGQLVLDGSGLPVQCEMQAKQFIVRIACARLDSRRDRIDATTRLRRSEPRVVSRSDAEPRVDLNHDVE